MKRLLASVRERTESSGGYAFNLKTAVALGLQFGAAFTFSHSIDDASDFFDNASGPALPQDGFRVTRWFAHLDANCSQMAEYPLWGSTSELPAGVTRTGRTSSIRRAYRPSAALTTTPGNFRPWS